MSYINVDFRKIDNKKIKWKTIKITDNRGDHFILNKKTSIFKSNERNHKVKYWNV